MSEALDKLVAERVMGWPYITFLAESPADGYIRLNRAYRGTDHPTDRCGKWEPSTSIAAAWEVVEHLRKQTKDDGTRKWLVSLIDKEEDVWECVIYEIGMYDVAWEEHTTPAMAVCIAALRLMNVPEATIQEACK